MRRLFCYIALLWLCIPVVSFAKADLNRQRVLFQQAEKALQTHQLTKFNQLKQQLDDYPLQAYLDYLYLRHRLHQASDDTIVQFIEQNKDTFYGQRLQNTWLNHLAKNKRWQTFLDHYQVPESVHRQCLRLQALINTGETEQALADIPELWLVSKSQDKACDPAFKYWQAQGQLTDDLRWQRTHLALQNKQFSLAKYLAKSLDNAEETTEWIKRWQQIHNKPQSLLEQLPSDQASSQTVSLYHDSALSREIIVHGIKRLSRKSTDKAYAAWQRIEPAYDFSEQDEIDVRHTIALRAALNRQDRTLEFFGDLQDEPWRVRAALWQQDWPEVETAISDLNEQDQQSTRWQYWLGRSQQQQGQHETATATWQALTTQRDYYSFLAADQLQQTYQMNHNPIEVSKEELELFSQRLEMKQLHEFYLLDMQLEARRQAYYLKQNSSTRELQLLATLTHQWGWHNQTIAVLGKAKYWDALDLRFPLVYNTEILTAAKTRDMNPSWLLGVARQESAFNPKARSHVGARGLMQLMPATGRLTAKLIKQPLKNLNELYVPNRNIQLGSAYLRKMYDDNQQNPVLATASYNAGPHRIKRWLPDNDLPTDIWIENIPFKETRRYTRSVLSYTAIFDYQRKQTVTPLSEHMPTIKAKELK